ncbi:MAG: NAD-dependent epimerase/dehydratase family protein [Patescibacteria group bacterium]
MKALVTGGAGFIGSNLVKALCDLDHRVVVLDDLSTGHRALVDNRCKFYKGSMANAKLLDKILPGLDVVFHLAATATITYSVKKPQVYFINNFMGGLALLEAMRRNRVKKIIYSSSGAGYGEPAESYVKESSPTNPINPYGASKLVFEQALSAYYHSFGIESASLRYFNVYGPRDEQKSSTRAISGWIKAALKRQPLILYWGGRQIRDYIYVEDVARANILAAQKCRGFKVYNVGAGQGIVMKDIVKKLEAIMGLKLKIKDLGPRPGDPEAVIADISRINKELGWQPKVEFDVGLKNMVDYYRFNRINI